MHLTTTRLQLREFNPDDLDAVHVYGSDPEVSTYSPWGPNSWADSQEYLDLTLAEQTQDPRASHNLAVAHQGRVIGAVHLARRKAYRAEIGYVFRRDAWGQGFATEAASAVLDWAFTTLAVHRIEATCRPDNVGSWRVLEKLGMHREGLLREHMLIRGTFQDSFLYAILAPDRGVVSVPSPTPCP